MPQVEIFAFIFDKGSLMPHTFIKVTGTDGTTTEYGFSPMHQGWPIDQGKLDINEGHPWNISSGKINISNDQYSALMSYINESSTTWPSYNLFMGRDCTTWAVGALSAASIPGVLAPHPYFRYFGDIGISGT